MKQRVVGRFEPDPSSPVRVTSRGLDFSGAPAAIWRIPAGVTVDLPAEAAGELTRLGYAVEVNADV